MKWSEGVQLLDIWLSDAGRKLQPEQQEEVISKFNPHGLPLYLKLAFEEARGWRSYTATLELKPDIPGIIQDLFSRLSSKENHGTLMVSRSLGYLAASKNGLSEDEMIDILSRDDDLYEDFIKRTYHDLPEKRLPVVIWSRLYLDMEPYLTERSADSTTLMSFYHRQFREAVEKEFLQNNSKIDRHSGLAGYFDEQPLVIGMDKSPNVRKVSELPYQQKFGKQWEDLERTLTDLMFIQAKFTAGLGYDLLADYNRVTTRNKAGPPIITARYYEGEYGAFCPFCFAWSKVKKDALGKKLDCPECNKVLILNSFTINAEWHPAMGERKKVEEVSLEPQMSKTFIDYFEFVLGDLHILLKHPDIIIQQALNQPDDSAVAIKARTLDNIGPWIKWINKPQKKSSCLLTLDGHTEWVSACSFSPDGKRIISASWDKTLRIWDAETGDETKVLRGHTRGVNACSFSPDGKRIISGSYDNTLRIWDAETEEKIKVLRGHTDGVLACSFSPDGKRIISGSYDNTLCIWDAETEEKIKVLRGHTSGVNACSFSPDGRSIISGSDDNTLCIWDAENGEEIKVLRGHIKSVYACSFSPDGKRLISGSYDNTMRIWDAETGEEIKVLRGHTRSVYYSSSSPDGKMITSVASGDKTLQVWDAETGEEIKVLSGHTDSVITCSFSPDGKRIVSTSLDKTLRIWDTETWKKIKVLRKHIEVMDNCSFSPDGNRIVSVSRDNTLRIWDTETGELIKVLRGHTDGLLCTFSPDGNRIVSASLDNTLRIWDAETGNTLGTFFALGSLVCLDVAKEQKKMAAGDEGGNLYVLSLNGLNPSLPFVTPIRLYLHDIHDWDSKLTVRCKLCGKAFFVKQTIIDMINSLNEKLCAVNGDHTIILKKALNNPGLITICPHCHNRLRLTPFIVDDAEKHIVENKYENIVRICETKC